MRGFNSLTNEEIELVCLMLNKTKFQNISFTEKVTPVRLSAMKDNFVRGCLGAILHQDKLDSEVKKSIENILKKNK